MSKNNLVLLSLRVLFIIAIGLIMLPTHTFAQNSTRVTVDGVPLSFDVEPIIRDGRTLVPIRTIFERLGASVEWDTTTRTITAIKSDQVIRLTIGSTHASVNNRTVALDIPAEIINNRTLVPVRFVSEALGANVDWRADLQTVVITTGFSLIGEWQSQVDGNTIYIFQSGGQFEEVWRRLEELENWQRSHGTYTILDNNTLRFIRTTNFRDVGGGFTRESEEIFTWAVNSNNVGHSEWHISQERLNIGGGVFVRRVP